MIELVHRCQGHKCFYCGEKFASGDRVVVLSPRPCPDIAHSDCWRKNRGKQV